MLGNVGLVMFRNMRVGMLGNARLVMLGQFDAQQLSRLPSPHARAGMIGHSRAIPLRARGGEGAGAGAGGSCAEGVPSRSAPHPNPLPRAPEFGARESMRAGRVDARGEGWPPAVEQRDGTKARKKKCMILDFCA